MHKRNMIQKMVFLCVVLILILIMIYSGLRILESTVLFGGDTESGGKSKTITRNGIDYFPRQDITTVLLMTADMEALVIFDETEKTSTMLFLDRDAPDAVPEGQWEKLRDAISAYLYDLEIDCFGALDREAVVILNDAVGGVTVAQEDSSDTVLLMGQEAAEYLAGVGPEQQMDYWARFGAAFLETVKQDAASLLGIFEQVKPHVVTDCSVVAAAGMLMRFGDYEIREPMTTAGEEFQTDAEALDRLILELFYAPKK